MPLTDDELRDVLARAEEIQRAARYGPEWNAELSTVIGAAEEVGLSRHVVERALRERLDLPATPLAVGKLVWAKSADDKFYVAELMSTSEHDARVRFLSGSEHQVTLDQLRPCAFIPGERVVCHWPWWGPWTCSVVAYYPVEQRVELSDGWGSTEIFPISEVWLAPLKAKPRAVRARAYVIGASAAVGALIGALTTALLMR